MVSDGSDLSGGHYWSNETNASVSWTFVGSLIEVFGRPDYEDGYMDVYMDTDPNQHTIKLVVAGDALRYPRKQPRGYRESKI
jgi:hypothetical protein